MNEPRTVQKQAAQGDLLVTRLEQLPAGLTPTARAADEPLIVAHSETGHHHAIDAADVIAYEPADPLVCYLRVDGEYADIVHHRPYDRHTTLRLSPGVYQITRAREWNPWTKSERRVQD